MAKKINFFILSFIDKFPLLLLTLADKTFFSRWPQNELKKYALTACSSVSNKRTAKEKEETFKKHSNKPRKKCLKTIRSRESVGKVDNYYYCYVLWLLSVSDCKLLLCAPFFISFQKKHKFFLWVKGNCLVNRFTFVFLVAAAFTAFCYTQKKLHKKWQKEKNYNWKWEWWYNLFKSLPEVRMREKESERKKSAKREGNFSFIFLIEN